MDSALLDDLTRWRETLADELTLRNSFPSDQALTETVQRILDRILFLRIAEARGALRGSPLRRAFEAWRRRRNGQLYAHLVQVFMAARRELRDGLFAPHASERRIIEHNTSLESILTKLYGEAPYRLEALPVETLGAIHERFLGMTLRRTPGGQVTQEERPEVRRAEGVYYTPRLIADTLVRRTLGPLSTGKSPSELLMIRVLDPACGAGTFLLAAYQHLLDAHLAHYARLPRGTRLPEEDVVARSDGLRLTLKRKREILVASIFGLDKDPQALEVAQMSLYLKLLEGEGEGEQILKDHGAHGLLRGGERLPSLAQNLLCGNALVSPLDLAADARADEERDPIRPFDWVSPSAGFGSILSAGGFTAIVGNPPYIRAQEMTACAPREAAVYKRKFKAAAKGSFNIYTLFVEQCLDLVARDTGHIGLIVPHRFFQAKYGEGLRRLLAERKAVREIVDFGDTQVFEGATTYTCLLFLTAAENRELSLRRVEPSPDLARSLDTAMSAAPQTLPSSALERPTWDFRGGGGDLAERLLAMRPVLGDPRVTARLFQGLITGADEVFYLQRRGSALYSRATGDAVLVEPSRIHPLLKGSVHIRRYKAEQTDLCALFPYELSAGRARLLSPARMAAEAPAAWAYLTSCKERLRERERGKWRDVEPWYAYGRSQALSLVSRPKILTPSIASRASFVVDEDGTSFFSGSGGGGGGGYGILLAGGAPMSMHYLCGLLNSRLLEWLLFTVATPYRGGYFAWNRQYIERLPVRLLDLSSTSGRAEHDAIASLARKLAGLAVQRDAAESAHPPAVALLDRQVAIAEAELNARIYRLYGVSDSEQRLIEDSLVRLESASAP